MNKSKHQLAVESFMLRAKQEVPVVPTTPSDEVRILRAKLILEEALETIYEGLGVKIFVDNRVITYQDKFDFSISSAFDLVETIDGCCDLKVVTTGTLSACGIPDEPFQKEVDQNNLMKFGPGHSIRDDGKLIKPKNHVGPNIERILSRII